MARTEMKITVKRMISKSLLLLGLGSVALVACAQQQDAAPKTDPAPKAVVSKSMAPGMAAPAAGTPEARALEAIKRMNPAITADSITAAPVPGFRQVVTGGQVVYVSDDGKYIFLSGQGGGLYDSYTKVDLTDQAMGAERMKLVNAIPKSERIVFAPANPKYTVTVFTDVECGYCRKLHSEIDQLNKEGIAVEYLAFPRQGLGSKDFVDMISVWCASDRKAALTAAKSGKPVPAKDCKNTVAAQYVAGQKAGLTGTPMILAADGTQLGGYLPPAVLKQRLDAWAKTASAPK